MSDPIGEPPPLQPYRPSGEVDPEMRRRALERLEARRAMRIHATVYALVMALLVAIWAVTGAGFFWPIFPMLGWGLGVALQAFALTWDKEPTEQEIAQEAERIRRRLGRDQPQDRPPAID